MLPLAVTQNQLALCYALTVNPINSQKPTAANAQPAMEPSSRNSVCGARTRFLAFTCGCEVAERHEIIARYNARDTADITERGTRHLQPGLPNRTVKPRTHVRRPSNSRCTSTPHNRTKREHSAAESQTRKGLSVHLNACDFTGGLTCVPSLRTTAAALNAASL